MISLAVAATGAIAGVLIGLTGIGGVLVVPALTEFGDEPVERAIAASMAAFLVAGTAAAVAHRRRAGVEWRHALPLCVAAAAGAVAGASSLQLLTAETLRAVIAVLALVSGGQALLAPRAHAQGRVPGSIALAAIGAAVGYGSAISGTGGPVLLIPVLLFAGASAHVSVALAFFVQVPITLSATIVNAMAGRIDPGLAAPLAALVLAGTLAGSRASARLSRRALSIGVAVTLIGVGVWYGSKALR